MKDAVAYDKLVGRAAALLFVYAGVSEVNSLVGSKEAEDILKKAGVKYSFKKTVSKILNEEKTDICPMDKEAAGKQPQEFFKAMA